MHPNDEAPKAIHEAKPGARGPVQLRMVAAHAQGQGEGSAARVLKPAGQRHSGQVQDTCSQQAPYRAISRSPQSPN